jgi:hypothetical protein
MIIGLAGAIGSGKSFTQLREALQYADDRQKMLVTNFSINIRELYKYAMLAKEADSRIQWAVYELRYLLAFTCRALGLKKYPYPKKTPRLPWIAWMCLHGGIVRIPSPSNLQSLFLPNSVVCLDEAGIFLNSREFAKTPRALLADLAQSRKYGCDLFWCAQFESQVDAQVRLLTQFWIHCDSLSGYDKKLKRPRLLWKNIFWFKAGDYYNWLQNLRDKSSYFKTRFAYSFKCISGPLNAADKQLFKVFDSFSRLDFSKEKSAIHTLFKCDLPQTYYLEKLGKNYLPCLDPFTRVYSPGKVSLLPGQSKDIMSEALTIAKYCKNPPFFRSMTYEQLSQWVEANRHLVP